MVTSINPCPDERLGMRPRGKLEGKSSRDLLPSSLPGTGLSILSVFLRAMWPKYYEVSGYIKQPGVRLHTMFVTAITA